MAVAAGLAPLAVGTETDGVDRLARPAPAGSSASSPRWAWSAGPASCRSRLAQDTAGPDDAARVADAAALLSALAGRGPGRPGDRARGRPARRLHRPSWTPARWPGPGSACGGTAPRRPDAATAAVLDAALALLRAAGAELVDPVDLPGAGQIDEPEFAALLHEFKHDLNAYLAGAARRAPGHPGRAHRVQPASTPARCWPTSARNIFERAEATSGDLGDAGYQAARAEAGRLARAALDGAARRPPAGRRRQR